MVNKFGPKSRESDFEIYKDKPIRVKTSPNDYALGIVNDYNSEYLFLKPSIIDHPTYKFDRTLVNNVVIEEDLPQKIKVSSINKIEPLKQGYLESFAQNLNEISHPQRIIIAKK